MVVEILLRVAWESWSVLGQMAPYLLFGFLMAGVLSVCISPEFVERHLGGGGFRPIVKAALFGVPLPLCSCGVIPVAASFRRHGASRAATASFLLSTPQTGVDSIAITYALLGSVVAVFRPIVALATGLLGGVLIWLFGEQENRKVDSEAKAPACNEPCCTARGRQNVLRRALVFGFVVLPRDIGLALLVGVVIAGVIGVLVPQNAWHAYLGGGILSIMAMMVLGIPLYVCASASVPIAAGLIHMGASPGAALAFLIAGPATNAATVTTVWKSLGWRTALLYLVTIAISAVGGGLVLDSFMSTLPNTLPSLGAHVHEAMGAGGLSAVWAVVLLLVVVGSYVFRTSAEPPIDATVSPDDARQAGRPQDAGGESPSLERRELAIEGMTCSHCADAVTRALTECDGAATVEVDLSSGRAVVAGKQLDAQQLVAAVNGLGYRARLLS